MKKPKQNRIDQQYDSFIRIIIKRKEKRCITCGTSENLELSHWIGRAHRGTRWDARNCHMQCIHCHQAHHAVKEGSMSSYTAWMVLHYGQGVIAELIKLKNSDVKYKDFETELKRIENEGN